MQTTKNQNMAGTKVQTSKVWNCPVLPDLARFSSETCSRGRKVTRWSLSRAAQEWTNRTVIGHERDDMEKNVLHKNRIGPIIRTNGTIFSHFYVQLGSPIKKKYVNSVISVIEKRLTFKTDMWTHSSVRGWSDSWAVFGCILFEKRRGGFPKKKKIVTFQFFTNNIN